MTEHDAITEFGIDADPSNVYFALNGFSYRGIAHLHGNFAETDSLTTNLDDAEVYQDGAVMWVVGGVADQTPVRTTLIAVRSNGEWRIKHSHRSPGSAQPRPGSI